MANALNKTTLKQTRDQAKIYKQFLPSLDLKRQQLLAALKKAKKELERIESEQASVATRLEELFPLLGSTTIASRRIATMVTVKEVIIEQENVVGTMLPVVRNVDFEVASFSRWVAPFWVDSLVLDLEQSAELRVQWQVAKERVARLELASRRITQRVNLFEKVLIPRAEELIRKIVIFLSDQERAAVVRSKLAKGKESTAHAKEVAAQ
jgi:V/A-type H+-transporting ATPase subunit D